MRYPILLLCLLFIQCSDSQTPAINDRVQALMADYDIPDLAITVVHQDQTVLLQTYGQANPNTLFSVQSVSKTFTALACLTAVESGLLDLDRPIISYWPEFRVNSLHEADAQEKITIRHLLSHTSGLPPDAPVGNIFTPEYQGKNYAPLAKRIASLNQVWLRDSVGAVYHYSNVGFDLAAFIIERVSGMEFESYVRENVLQPLNMYNSTFQLETLSEKEDKAMGHCYGTSDSPPIQFSAVGAGGLYTSGRDLEQFLNAAIKHFRPLLDTSSYREMTTVPFSPSNNGYALGLTVNHFRHCVPMYSHTGNGYGFSALVSWCPDHKLGIALVANRESSFNALQEIQRLILEAFSLSENCVIISDYPSTIPRQEKLYFQNLAGDYTNGSVTLTFEIRDNTFGILAPNDGSFHKIHFLSRDYWVFEDGDQYHFQHQKGTITNLNNGMSFQKTRPLPEREGPNKEAWSAYAGTYQSYAYGILESVEYITLVDGYLYLNGNLLTEHLPDLFFDQSGQVVDFRSSPVQIEYGKYLRR